MNRNKLWKVLTFIVVLFLLMSVAPEARILGLLIDGIGLDLLLLLLEIQIMALVVALFHYKLKPCLFWLDKIFRKLDPYYFVSSCRVIKSYPPILLHCVPFLVCFYLIIVVGASVYTIGGHSL